MRGTQTKQSSMVCLISPESRVPKEHPLRRIKQIADEALSQLDGVFEAMYCATGRPSVPPERLLKSMLLMGLYSVRSDRQLCEQLDYNLLFRWFLDMDMVEDSFDASTFSHNRERLMRHDVTAQLFSAVVEQAQRAALMSREHFSVDGTLIEAWASMKSFRPKDGSEDDQDSNGWVDFRGKSRTNDTHHSCTDPEAKLLRKGRGKEAKLCFSAHALMENRNGLLMDLRIADASPKSEPDMAVRMMDETIVGTHRITVGADRGYNTKAFVRQARQLGATPHVAQYRNGRGVVDGRTTRHRGYRSSLRVRLRIEQIFGWLKTTGHLRKTRFKGKRRTQMFAYTAATAYNLIPIAKLAPQRI
jgi:transposase